MPDLTHLPCKTGGHGGSIQWFTFYPFLSLHLQQTEKKNRGIKSHCFAVRKSVKRCPTLGTRAVPAGEPAARAPLMERMFAPCAQRRALIVTKLHLAHHASVHGCAKENQLELHTPTACHPPPHHLDAAQLSPIHTVLRARHMSRHRHRRRRRRRRYSHRSRRRRSYAHGARRSPCQKHVLAIPARDGRVPVIVIVVSSFQRF